MIFSNEFLFFYIFLHKQQLGSALSLDFVCIKLTFKQKHFQVFSIQSPKRAFSIENVQFGFSLLVFPYSFNRILELEHNEFHLFWPPRQPIIFDIFVFGHWILCWVDASFALDVIKILIGGKSAQVRKAGLFLPFKMSTTKCVQTYFPNNQQKWKHVATRSHSHINPSNAILKIKTVRMGYNLSSTGNANKQINGKIPFSSAHIFFASLSLFPFYVFHILIEIFART